MFLSEIRDIRNFIFLIWWVRNEWAIFFSFLLSLCNYNWGEIMMVRVSWGSPRVMRNTLSRFTCRFCRGFIGGTVVIIHWGVGGGKWYFEGFYWWFSHSRYRWLIYLHQFWWWFMEMIQYEYKSFKNFFIQHFCW